MYRQQPLKVEEINNEESNNEESKNDCNVKGEKPKRRAGGHKFWTRVRIHNKLETYTGQEPIKVSFIPETEAITEIEDYCPLTVKKKDDISRRPCPVIDDSLNIESDVSYEPNFEKNTRGKATLNKKKKKVAKKLTSTTNSDTEYDEEDDEEFTCNRKMTKCLRYERRVGLKNSVCPSFENGNKEVIERFEKFLKYRYNITSWNRKTSTYKLSLNHLFRYEDSMLNFELRKDSTFKLEYQATFDHPQFRELSDPSEWFLSSAGESGKEGANDRVEKIKAWKRYNIFIKDELNKSRTKCGSGVEELVRYQMLATNLDNLYNTITTNNMMKNAKIASNLQRRERENVEEYLSPNKRLAEKDAVKNWFNSEKYRELLDEMILLWKSAIATKDISKKDFTRFAQFVKFQLCLTSKNRNSVYKFTNSEYGMRMALWIKDSDDFNLPTNYITSADENNPDEPPNCWIIKLSGSGAGIKNQEAQTIFINKTCQDLLTKYEDLKQLFLPNESLSNPFFVNLDSKPLGDIPNTKGSLWDKFTEVSKLDKASINTIRRGLEHEVQSSPAAVSKIKDIQSHSQDTGKGAYYKTSPYVRAKFMSTVAAKEGANTYIEEEEVPDDIRELRQARELENKLKCQDSVLKKRTLKRKRISKTTSLLPADRDFLEEILTDENNHEIFTALKKKFPINCKFKRLFYRLLDGYSNSMPDEVKLKLREIEERIFLSVKDDIEKEYEQSWEKGSDKINRVADKKICAVIRNSFYYHEKNKPKSVPHVFKFSK